MTNNRYHDAGEYSSLTLSDILREIGEDLPPPAPPDLLSTVSSLFSGRVEMLRREREAAEAEARAEVDRLEDAAMAEPTPSPPPSPPRKPFSQRLTVEELQERERLRRERVKARRAEPKPLSKLSRAELGRLLDDEVAKEATGLGMKQAECETGPEYEERIRALEARLDRIAIFGIQRQSEATPRYVEGMPASLVSVHPYARPPQIPRASRRTACLQCRTRKMPCSRTVDALYGPASKPGAERNGCSRCVRNGDRCMAKDYEWRDDDNLEAWRFVDKKGGRKEEKALAKELFGKMSEKGRIAAPLPAWHENDQPENRRDGEYKPKGYWNILNDRDTHWR
ncbi:hypothetical protein ACJ41O_011256 [Fusarium nematophilum]